MTTEIKDSNRVGFKLMDGGHMGDIIDIALEDNDSAEAELMPGGYWELDAEGELVIDLQKISAWLEQPFDEKDFLQYVSSFYGRVSVEDGKVRLASELLMVSDYQAQEAKF
ncbi:MAG TPA: MmoB/DmpM family protein [Actinomycetota bacterium]|nr:MmoB/DmpM family protein [Actinomycetota bacterium]